MQLGAPNGGGAMVQDNSKKRPTHLKLISKDGQSLDSGRRKVISPSELRRRLEAGGKLTSIRFKGKELLRKEDEPAAELRDIKDLPAYWESAPKGTKLTIGGEVVAVKESAQSAQKGDEDKKPHSDE